MIRTPRPSHLAAAAVLLASVTACGGAPGAQDAGGGGGADDRIRLAMLQPPRSGLSPLSDDAFKLSRWSTAETLVTLDDEGGALPGLATSWEQADDLTWRFAVRDGVTFHDGTELTAEQAAASLTAAAEASPPPRILDGVTLTAEADGDTLVVTTGEPDPLVPQRLSSPQLAVLAASAYAPDGTVSPVGTGTGPYELTEVAGTAGAT
ncbi:ABC transporter substrate-binding protein, partial [Nocardioides kribbensis]